jgi:phosphoglycerate dehydrogenase-like enzyme
VFEYEPYQELDLLSLPNVVATPHTAFYSDQGNEEMIAKAAEEAKRILLGEDPLYCVNSPFITKART